MVDRDLYEMEGDYYAKTLMEMAASSPVTPTISTDPAYSICGVTSDGVNTLTGWYKLDQYGVTVGNMLILDPISTSTGDIEGAMYYDSDDNIIKFYNGASWEPLLYSGSGVTNPMTAALAGGGYAITNLGDVTVGNTTTSANRTLNILANDSYIATINLMGSAQGTGRVYVGQSATHGGGITYSGDATPSDAFADDNVTIFRRSASVDYPVISILHSSNTATFAGSIAAPSGSITIGGATAEGIKFEGYASLTTRGGASWIYCRDAGDAAYRGFACGAISNNGTFACTSTSTFTSTITSNSNMTMKGRVYLYNSTTNSGYLYANAANDVMLYGDADLRIDAGTKIWSDRIWLYDAESVGNDRGMWISEPDHALGTQASALRYKTDIVDMGEEVYDKWMQLRPRYFTWKKTGYRDWGMIAEEVFDIYPQVVTKNRDENGDLTIFHGIEYQKLMKPAVKVIQMMDKKIKNLEARLDALESV